jgi:hypothetical protein
MGLNYFEGFPPTKIAIIPLNEQRVRILAHSCHHGPWHLSDSEFVGTLGLVASVSSYGS